MISVSENNTTSLVLALEAHDVVPIPLVNVILAASCVANTSAPLVNRAPRHSHLFACPDPTRKPRSILLHGHHGLVCHLQGHLLLLNWRSLNQLYRLWRTLQSTSAVRSVGDRPILLNAIPLVEFPFFIEGREDGLRVAR